MTQRHPHQRLVSHDGGHTTRELSNLCDQPRAVSIQTAAMYAHKPDPTLASRPMISMGPPELILGDNLINGIMSLESRIRQLLMDVIASGTDLLSVFRRFDVNHDGSIEQREMVQALIGLGLKPQNWGSKFEDDVLAFIDKIDSFDSVDNGGLKIEYDRKVDYREFIDFVMEKDMSLSPRNGMEGLHSTGALLAGKAIVGIFFGASWAPQTHKVNTMLNLFYKNLKEAGDNRFEVIYCSHDQNAEQFYQFYESHPWLAVPYEDSTRRKYMEHKLFVNTFPRLVLLDCTGAVLSYDAKFEVMDAADNPQRAMKQWLTEAYVSHQRQDAPRHRHTGR